MFLSGKACSTKLSGSFSVPDWQSGEGTRSRWHIADADHKIQDKDASRRADCFHVPFRSFIDNQSRGFSDPSPRIKELPCQAL